MNTISIKVTGFAPVTASSPDGQPVTANLVVPNGEGEGSGINVTATLTPTMQGNEQDWIVRTENNADACDVTISARIASSIIHAGTPLTLTSERGVVASRAIKVGGTPFRDGTATPDANDTVFVDVAEFALPVGQAQEFGASVQ